MNRPLPMLFFALLAALLFAIAFPISTGGGYEFSPRYAASLEEGRLVSVYPAPDSAQLPETLLAHSGDYLGYLDLANRQVRFSRRRAYGIAATDWGFINYPEAPANLLVQSSYGEPLFSLGSEGFPFGRSTGLFLLHADGYTLSEYDETGERVWSVGEVTPVTAFDATPGARAVGFLSGTLYLKEGEQEWQELRLPEAEASVVYDLAFSHDGESLLVRSGLDPQSLTLYDLSGEEAQRRWTEEVDEPSVRSEALAVLSPAVVAVELAGGVELRSYLDATPLARHEEAGLGDAVYFPESRVAAYTLRRSGGGETELRIFDEERRPLFLGSGLPGDLRIFADGALLVLASGETVAVVEVGP